MAHIIRNRLSGGKTSKRKNDRIGVNCGIIHVAQYLSEFERIHLPTRDRGGYGLQHPLVGTKSSAVGRENGCHALVENFHERGVVFGGFHLLLVQQLDYGMIAFPRCYPSDRQNACRFGEYGYWN